MYQPSEFTDSISNYMDIILGTSKLAILVGDFNLNLYDYQQSSHVKHFNDSLSNIGMLPTIGKPTRITHNSQTLIDNIYTNFLTPTSRSNVLLEDLSDHLPILFTFSLTKSPHLPVTPSPSIKRLYSKKNFLSFLLAVESINWDPILYGSPHLFSITQDEMYNTFYQKNLSQLSTHLFIQSTHRLSFTSHTKK